MTEKDTCPKCGSKNLEWLDHEFENGMEELWYDFDCQDCGFRGSEKYKITYVETVERD